MHTRDDNDGVWINPVEDRTGEPVQRRPAGIAVENLEKLGPFRYTCQRRFQLNTKRITEPGTLTLVPEVGIADIRFRRRSE
jgi:hypothetical protein